MLSDKIPFSNHEQRRRVSVLCGARFLRFSFGFAMAAIRQLKKTAAAMRAAPAVIPPVNTPRMPFSFTAAFTPSLKMNIRSRSAHGGAAAREIHERCIPPERTQEHTARDVGHHDSGRGELCQIDQKLTDHTDCPADRKRPYIFHVKIHTFRFIRFLWVILCGITQIYDAQNNCATLKQKESAA